VRHVEPVTDLSRPDERLETPVQRVGTRSGARRRLGEGLAAVVIVALLAGAGGRLNLQGTTGPVNSGEPLVAVTGGDSSPGSDRALDATVPTQWPVELPTIYLVASGRPAPEAASAVVLVPGCRLTIAYAETLDGARGCDAMLPIQVPHILQAAAGTPLTIVVPSGEFTAAGAGSDPIFCGRIIEAGAGVAPDPTCDVEYPDDSIAMFAIHGAGSRRVAITGCAVVESRSACGVWWAWVRTTA
jgi:hypothetical protein